jgi:hypothetical protein
MRCPKCGYISFDHLANCNKCSRDLSDSRETLNLPDFEPQVPFLLGSLVGEMQGGGAAYQQELSLTQETELELGGLEAPELEEMEETVEMESMRETLDTESSEELKLSEIDLDDLDTLEASETAAPGAGQAQMSELTELSAEGATSAEEDEELLGLDFDIDDASADDIDAFEETLAGEPAETPSMDSLELDLNDDDLSELAKTLETHLEAEIGGKKKAGPDDASSEPGEVTLEMQDD